jgi:predicted Zn-dependent protease
VPTKHPRIPATKDAALAEALAQVERYFDGAPAARVVHDLAIKGAGALVEEERRREEAIERLIAWSTRREEDALDWEALANARDEAWRD